jgi:RecA/RadA recombinase
MVAAYLSKLMKSDRVFTAEQIRKKRENSLVSTGSVSFDWALGGGIPRNEMTLLWGTFSAGKSSLMYKMLAKEQLAFPNKIAIIFDSEYSFSPERAESLGVDVSVDKLIIIQGNSFNDCIAPFIQAEKEIIKEKNICFIGVDSVKGFVSASLENLFDNGKADGTATLYGGIAKTLNPLLDLLNRLANEAECMVILTNHAAANLDPRMSKYYPYVLTGGMKLRHLVSTCAFMDKVNSQSKMLRDSSSDVAIGGTFKVKVTKNRRTVEGKQSEFLWNLISGEFVEQELELANLAKDLKVFQEGDKANSLVFKEGDLVQLEAKNLPAAASILKQRPALFKKVLEACYKITFNPTLGIASDDFKDDIKYEDEEETDEESSKKKGKKK